MLLRARRFSAAFIRVRQKLSLLDGELAPLLPTLLPPLLPTRVDASVSRLGLSKGSTGEDGPGLGCSCDELEGPLDVDMLRLLELLSLLLPAPI